MAIGKTGPNKKRHLISRIVTFTLKPENGQRPLMIQAAFKCGSGGRWNYLEEYYTTTRRGRVNCKNCRKAMGWDK